MTPSPKQRQWIALRDDPSRKNFQPVFEATRGLVYTICYRTLRNEEDALDALQSTYARLLGLVRESGDTPADEDLIRTVRVLAAREASNLSQRRARRRRREVIVDDLVNFPSKKLEPDQIASNLEVRERIETLLATLPDRYRLPLLYYFFNEMNQAEIAEALGVSTATINRRIKTGLRKLKPVFVRAGLGEVSGLMAAFIGTSAVMTPASSLSAGEVFAKAWGAESTVPASALVNSGMAKFSIGVMAMKTKAALAGGILVIALALPFAFNLLRSVDNENPPGPDGDRANDTPSISSAPTDLASDIATSAAPRQDGRNVAAQSTQDTSGIESGATVSTVDDSPSDRREIASEPESAEPPGPPSGVTVFGRILEAENERPVSGANVYLLPGPRGGTADSRRTTDEEGRFEFKGVMPSDPRVLYGAKGHWLTVVRRAYPVWVSVIDRGGEVIIEDHGESEPYVLEARWVPGVRIRVSSAVTGEPIRGAEIILIGAMARDDRTDKNGEIDLALTSEYWTIQILASGHAMVQKELNLTLAKERAEVDVVLEAGGEVYGLTSDRDGDPISGVDITAVWGSFRRSTRSDEAGSFRLESMPLESEFRLEAYRREDIADRFEETVRLTADEPIRKLNITFRGDEEEGELGTIAGVVVDKQGRPVEALVYFRTITQPKGENFTGPDGKFILTGLKSLPGGNIVTVFPIAGADSEGPRGGYEPTRAEINPSSPIDPPEETIRLAEGHWIEGRVVDATADPIEGIIVAPMILQTSLLRLNSRTDKDGRFKLKNLTDSAQISLEGPGYTTKIIPRAPLDRTEIIEFTLLGEGSIIGSVVDDETNAPIGAFTIKVGMSSNMRVGEIFLSTGASQADAPESFESDIGYFRLEQLSAGAPYLLTLEAEGYAPQSFDRVMAHDDLSFEAVEIRLKRGSGLIGGVVVDSKGRPVEGAEIMIVVYRDWNRFLSSVDWSEFKNSSWLLSVTLKHERISTDADGGFSFTNVPPDRPIDLFIMGPNIARRHVSEIEALEEEKRHNLVIQVETPGRIYGRIDRSVYPEVTGIEIFKTSGVSDRQTINLRADQTEFEIADLEGGSYSVLLYGLRSVPPGTMIRENQSLRQVTLPEGGAVEVDFDSAKAHEVGGWIFIGEDPMTEGTVVLKEVGRGTRVNFQTRTDTDGAFSFPHVDPGTYDLIAVPPDFVADINTMRMYANSSNLATRQRIEVGDADLYRDFHFLRYGGMRGRLVDLPNVRMWLTIMGHEKLTNDQPISRWAELETDGNFFFRGIPEGTYGLTLSDSIGSRLIRDDIEMPGGGIDLDLGEISVARAGRLRVAVAVTEPVQGSPNISVALYAMSTPPELPARIALMRYSEDQESILFEDLPLGRVKVLVNGQGYLSEPQWAEIEIEENEVAELGFQLRPATFLSLSSRGDAHVTRIRAQHNETGRVIDLEEYDRDDPALLIDQPDAYFSNRDNMTVGHLRNVESGWWNLKATDSKGRVWSDDLKLVPARPVVAHLSFD